MDELILKMTSFVAIPVATTNQDGENFSKFKILKKKDLIKIKNFLEMIHLK